MFVATWEDVDPHLKKFLLDKEIEIIEQGLFRNKDVKQRHLSLVDYNFKSGKGKDSNYQVVAMLP